MSVIRIIIYFLKISFILLFFFKKTSKYPITKHTHYPLEKSKHTYLINPFTTPQVMHGGLFSQDDVTLADIRKIERDRQPPDSGVCV